MKKLLLGSAFCALSTLAQAQLFNIAPNQGADAAEAASPAAAPATSAPAADNAALLHYLAETRDLQGSFSQTVQGQRGAETSGGSMWISKPGKFYWDYQGANAQKIISNGSKVWQYDVDLEQISVRGRDELVGDVAMEILSGSRGVEELFAVTAVAQAQLPVMMQAKLQGGQAYRLTPLTEQDGYDAVWVIMRNDALAALGVDAGRGQQTLIEFRDLQRNVGIPASRFEFTPPPGVDVIGE